MKTSLLYILGAATLLSGCQALPVFQNAPAEFAAVPPEETDAARSFRLQIGPVTQTTTAKLAHQPPDDIQLTSAARHDGEHATDLSRVADKRITAAEFLQDGSAGTTPGQAADSDESGASQVTNPIGLRDVVDSVHVYYPLVEIATLEFDIASGNQIAAWGAFDTKVKAASENGPTGFYQTYRNSAGVVRPLFTGGEVFGGYRVGRGDFQPWYQERQTNDAGEFKAGLRVPWARNREIDQRRAALWRANYERQRVQPEIRAQLIMFVRDASAAYWKWIALGKQYAVGQRALELAQDRNAKLKKSVAAGNDDPPVLQDNLRAIAQREAKLIDRRRKLQQAAIKLSLFLRDPDGAPRIPDDSNLGEFPPAKLITREQRALDLQQALQQRPELSALDAMYRRTSVDLQAADNNFLPAIDTILSASQDVGEPTSSKRDKSEFEVEAGVYFDLPLQRRKARGKQTAAHAKLQQIQAKRRFTADKITVEVQMAWAAMRAAFEKIEKTQEARRLAEYMAEVEGKSFDAGLSDLLKVVLREQYAIEAADAEIEALREYFTARAMYDAARAIDRPTQ